MENFTPVSAVIGGVLIGISATMMLALNGRLAGISGIVAELVPPRRGDIDWRLIFIGGLLIGTFIYQGTGPSYELVFDASLPVIAIGGLLTGLGTRVGGGCTSAGPRRVVPPSSTRT